MPNTNEILFFVPIWGNTLSEDDFIARAKASGYDGIETALLGTEKENDVFLQKISDAGLGLIAQQWQTAMHSDYESHKKEMITVLETACRAKPLKINTQTGKDYYSFEQNSELIAIAEDMSAKHGVQIVHEIHRSRFNAHPLLLQPYLKAFPEIQLTADLSHWCCVCESLLEDQQEMLESVMPKMRHVHARVGFSQGPQVNDFLAPEHENALLRHLSWWDSIVKIHQEQGYGTVTFTPEFGPAPYMPALPYTNLPIADQWQQNQAMMMLLKARYQ